LLSNVGQLFFENSAKNGCTPLSGLRPKAPVVVAAVQSQL
jgi:hypothetical protein